MLPTRGKGVIWEKTNDIDQHQKCRATVYVNETHSFHEVFLHLNDAKLKSIVISDWINWTNVEQRSLPPDMLLNLTIIPATEGPFKIDYTNECKIDTPLLFTDRSDDVVFFGEDIAWSYLVGPVLIPPKDDSKEYTDIKRGVYGKALIHRDKEATKDRMTEFVMEWPTLKFQELKPGSTEEKKIQSMYEQMEKYKNDEENKKLQEQPVVPSLQPRYSREERDARRIAGQEDEPNDEEYDSTIVGKKSFIAVPGKWMTKERRERVTAIKEFLNITRYHLVIIYNPCENEPGHWGFSPKLGSVYVPTLCHSKTSQEYDICDWVECRIQLDKKRERLYVDQIVGDGKAKQKTWISDKGYLMMRTVVKLSMYMQWPDQDYGTIEHPVLHLIYVDGQVIRDYGPKDVHVVVAHNRDICSKNEPKCNLMIADVMGYDDGFGKLIGEEEEEVSAHVPPLETPSSLLPNEEIAQISDMYEALEDDDSDEEDNVNNVRLSPPPDLNYVNGPYAKPHIRPPPPSHFVDPNRIGTPPPGQPPYHCNKDGGYSPNSGSERGGGRYRDKISDRDGQRMVTGGGAFGSNDSFNKRSNYNDDRDRQSSSSNYNGRGRGGFRRNDPPPHHDRPLFGGDISYNKLASSNVSDRERRRVEERIGVIMAISRRSALVYTTKHELVMYDGVLPRNFELGQTIQFDIEPLNRPVDCVYHSIIRNSIALAHHSDIIRNSEIHDNICYLRVRAHLSSYNVHRDIFSTPDVADIRIYERNIELFSGNPKFISVDRLKTDHDYIALITLNLRTNEWRIVYIDDEDPSYELAEEDDIDRMKRENHERDEAASRASMVRGMGIVDPPQSHSSARYSVPNIRRVRGGHSTSSNIRAPPSEAEGSTITMPSFVPTVVSGINLEDEFKLIANSLKAMWTIDGVRQQVKQENYFLYQTVDDWCLKEQKRAMERDDD